ncbi:oxysterol-binding protein-related protein 9-like protein [Dermatophagoides farinae]|uniref:Oxysterol-binding protein n=1 Tax=Dermatophagoides farinae TaxID=6954 RepID=A0A9D4SGA1_DERFA|nr:oxysterol-binding protein-related protein 9-like protein [Dermatophagoides farinae]
MDKHDERLSTTVSPEKLVRGDRRGCIRLRDAIIGIEDDDDTIFSITSDTEVFHCKAHSMKERDEWINCLADIIQLFQRQRKRFRYKNKAESYALLLPTQQQQQQQQQQSSSIDNNDDNEKILNQFNQRLIETDSYLQILIKQFQKLDSKIIIHDKLNNNNDQNNCNDHDDKQEKFSITKYEQKRNEQLKKLKERSTYFLDSIKHTIVLLQIAKNLKFPVNGIYRQQQQQQKEQQEPQQQYEHHQEPRKSSLSTVNEINVSPTIESTTTTTTSNDDDEKQFVVPVSVSSSPQQQQQPSSTFQSAKSALDVFVYSDNFIKNYNRNQTVPDLSYASSDDDFFDANDESENSDLDLKNSSLSTTTTTTTKMPSTKKTLRTTTSTTSSRENNDDDDDQINFDKLYESSDDSGDDLCSISSHGSVISHLIAQVKIGMDLTKVALPTFILERRSLLEMYADFFAHADIFCSIPDYKTPEERMIQVTRWYLSAFHAGRKGSIAKKPYNPILGEVFKCYWNLSQNNDSTKSIVSNNDGGQLPWAKISDLIFIAEQVSHHPPISAFYAENIDKRIMCCAQIWTKSKFLGLSIGVNNIGQGSIYLLDHGEEYTCTFPSAYGRSILTEPWFEFGGSVQIECQKSGYSAKIDFLTKPFYGGKRNRINAEIFDPNKKTMATITGEWNGKMEAKFSNNKSTTKSEPFVDTKTLPVIRKQVKPINEQDEYESRNLWKKVTYALKQQNVDQATEAKHEIEQRQRELVKEREQNAMKWQNRMFHNIGDKWAYNDPLTNRKPSNR